MPRHATVRELKNQTTALLREAERGTPVVVTRRGKPVATLKPFEAADLERSAKYSTAAFDAMQAKILRSRPELARATAGEARREFEKLTRKIRRSLPFRSWREMDRAVKGARYRPAR